MIPNPPQSPVHFLKPGELFVTDRPHWVITVLGSCVSVTMFDERNHVGGISHALLPEKGMGTPGHEFRFVDASLEFLLRKMDALGVRRRDLQVKLFGGADVLSVGRHFPAGHSVGQRNVVTALEMIEREGLVLSVSEVGGVAGRKIVFNTQNGKVLLKQLPTIDSAGLAAESERRRRVRGDKVRKIH